ncbi:CotH kinase family protein [Caballeronia sp. BR00000012568055]|uniref:CotH kinase family protein n=1 Tax=Caballeronia sp. BR00000012568055 TaxID=2918761 RepID=UPI0023F67482|nr:CotH kinase family protein [Caballeronia sp. BR00000012568055]
MKQWEVAARKGARGFNAKFVSVCLAACLAACGGGGSSSNSADAEQSVTDFIDPTGAVYADAAPLASMTVDTDGKTPIVVKSTYLGADLGLTGADGIEPFSSRMTIKGHGNSTWTQEKKPYRLKLESKASLLGMPQDRNWILLANYFDKTLLRNRAALELGQRFGMAWTPRAQPLELTLNGEYRGVYDLVESIRVSKNRVNIADSDETTSPKKTGFIVEINARMDEAVCWHTTHGLPMCIDTPDPASDAQAAYIKDYVQKAEDALFSDNATDPATGYEQYFDVPTLIDWFLVNEIFKNQDAKSFASIYLYKDAGDKLKFGPLWDFDLAAGNVNYSDAQYPEGWWVADGVWISRMKQIDPTFEARVRARWNELKTSQIDTLPDFIESRAQALIANGAARRNFTRWKEMAVQTWPNAVIAGSYRGEVDYLKGWLVKRIAWMDGNI